MTDQTSTIIEPEADKTVEAVPGKAKLRIIVAFVIVVAMIANDVLTCTALPASVAYISRMSENNGTWLMIYTISAGLSFLTLAIGAIGKTGVLVYLFKNPGSVIKRLDTVIIIQAVLGALWAVIAIVSSVQRGNSNPGLLQYLPLVMTLFEIGLFAIYLGVTFALRFVIKWACK